MTLSRWCLISLQWSVFGGGIKKHPYSPPKTPVKILKGAFGHMASNCIFHHETCVGHSLTWVTLQLKPTFIIFSYLGSVFWGMMIFLLQLSTFRNFNNGVEDELDDSGGACCPKLLGSFSMYAQRKLCAHSLILCMRKKMWEEWHRLCNQHIFVSCV